MEGDDGPSAVTTTPNVIKAAQEEIGRLDVLVCGQCHSVFHFVEELQEHHTKEGACPKVSHYRENSDNGQKAQIWAFLLWKDSHIQQEGLDKNSTNAWKMYQKWCKLDTHERDSWIVAGKTIQTFTKISTTKMQETPIQVQSNESTTTTTPDGKTVVFRKIVKNGQPEEETTEAAKDTTKSETKTPQRSEPVKVDVEKKEKPKIKPSIKKIKLSKASTEENSELSNDEYVIEKILAKRFNPKKKCPEYLIKWEDHSHDNNTWETAETIAAYKDMVDEFERSLAKQKELKAQQANAKIVQARASVAPAQKVIKIEASKPGPSTAPQAGRPMRSSKSKAMNQVKQWCGSMKDEENELTGKRRIDDSDSDSDDVITAKRAKADTGSDDDWTGESEDDRLIGRSDMIQRAFSRAHAQSNGSNKASVSSTDLATSLGLQSPEGKSSQAPVLVANAKGVVKVDPKQMPNLTSGVYLMSRKDGIIKLDSSPSGKMAVKGSPTPGTTPLLIGVSNRGDNIVRKQIVSTSQSNSLTPTVKVVSKVEGSPQVKMIPCKTSTPKTGGTQKIEPIKIQPKPDPTTQVPQIHVVTAVQAPITLQPRITTGVRPTAITPQRPTDCRPLLPRPTLRTVMNTSSVLNTTTIRTPVKAPAPKQVQTPATTRPVVQKRTTTIVSTPVASPNSTSTATQKPKVTGIIASPQTVVQTVHAKQVVKPGTSPVQQQQQSQQTKPSPKIPVAKTQSLLTPQQKLLIAKKKAQEAAGIIKAGGRGFLTGARAGVGRGKAKSTEGIGQLGSKTKESKLAEGDGLHMEFHEVHSEESSSEDEPDLPPVPEPDAITAPEPDSPPRPFTLCPLTGRIIGPDGEPIDQPEPEPETTSTTTSTTAKTTTTSSESAAADTTVTTTSSAELTLPSLDSLTESGGIMRVEMSPGGTTGTIVQTSEASTAQINLSTVAVPAPDLPCLDDTAPGTVNAPVSTSTATTLTETSTSTASEIKTEPSITTALSTITTSTATNITATSTDIKSEEKITEEGKVTTADTSNLVTIAEHGVVYQVAGQAEDGQTLLVARGADGEQQCVYVTTEQQGDEGSVLTLDHAVAEAVAQLIPDQVNLTPQFYVKEDGAESSENSMVMSIMDNANAADVTATQEDNDGQAQVVAQVVQAEEPTPGGTRRVVLLLPDGNLMMTEVDEEQYAALELDK